MTAQYCQNALLEGSRAMKSTKPNHSIKYVAPFGRKMNNTAISILSFGMLIDAPIAFSYVRNFRSPIMLVISQLIGVVIWAYLSAIILQFYRRTRLREYILQIHTFWLAGIITYPIAYLFSYVLFLFHDALPTSLYTFLQFLAAASWLILLLVGKELCKRRIKQMEIETQSNSATWKRLLSLDLKNIVLLRFPANR